MDFKKEIWGKSLPNFGYVIEMDNGNCCVVVLGGQSSEKTEEYAFRDSIYHRNIQMQKIYHKEVLSDDDKKELAVLMQKMYSICDARKEGLYTWEEQSAFIETLSKTGKMQLEDQIQMLNVCREFYREFIYR